MRGAALSVLASASLASLGSPAVAASDCASALDEYRDAYSAVVYAANRYIKCLGNDDPADDCSTEFRRLRRAQTDFESAASEATAYCRD